MGRAASTKIQAVVRRGATRERRQRVQVRGAAAAAARDPEPAAPAPASPARIVRAARHGVPRRGLVPGGPGAARPAPVPAALRHHAEEGHAGQRAVLPVVSAGRDAADGEARGQALAPVRRGRDVAVRAGAHARRPPGDFRLGRAIDVVAATRRGGRGGGVISTRRDFCPTMRHRRSRVRRRRDASSTGRAPRRSARQPARRRGRTRRWACSGTSGRTGAACRGR